LSQADLVIKNGRVAVSSSLRECAIAAKGGKITWIGPNSNAPTAPKVIDATGLLVLPGVIDVHVHMRDPGATYKEDFRSGTAAAAAGGVTTVFDMPNNTPPTKDVEALRSKMAAAEEKALVDYAFYGVLTEGNSGEIAGLLSEGVIGFKWYMADTTGQVASPSGGELSGDLSMLADAGTRVSVHAEDNEMLQDRISKLREKGRRDPVAHYESRPERVEEAAVGRAIALARKAKCDLHIAHLSSAAGAMEVKKAKLARRRGGLTAETCPQYLLLDKDDYAEKRSLMKANPSVKRKEDRLALWRAVRDGTIDMIATDHAPHTIEEKTSGASIFEQASGFPGLETSVALMLTCVERGLLSLSRYVQLTSSGPAKAWGLYPKKGRIGVGSDADLTIVDTKREWKIDPARFLSKAKYSPFEGFKAKGAAVYTVVRGHPVMEDGHIDNRFSGEMQTPL
jgi:dihydroorotase